VEWFLGALIVLSTALMACADEPLITAVTPVGPLTARVTLTHCSDANSYYVFQYSTNLQNWISDWTNGPAISNDTQTNYVLASGDSCFYRAIQIPRVPLPMFAMGLVCRSNFNASGHEFLVDSFDSSNTNYSTLGQWDITKRKAGGDMGIGTAVIGVISALNNDFIYGHLYTGPGSQSNVAQIGTNSAIGDLLWNATSIGIESNGTPQSWWLPRFNVNLPDVVAPGFIGVSLPGGGVVGADFYDQILNGDYVVTGSVSLGNVYVSGRTRLWVKGSPTLDSLVIASTNNASLVLYAGTTLGSPSTINLGGNGALNNPGYARNFQIYGLPSVNNIVLAGSSSFTGTIYAPNGIFKGGYGGNNVNNSAGSIVVKGITLVGRWHFHYDEDLKVNGPMR
jgi:hypothetical protein